MIIRGSTFALSALCLWWTPSVLYDWLPCPGSLQRTLRLGDEPSTSEIPTTTEQVKRAAIVGAGTAGLAALKTFIHDIPKPDGQRWEIELFERRNGLGGIWSVLRFSPTLVERRILYHRLQDDSAARYPYLPETPLYPQLHTNTPALTSDYLSQHPSYNADKRIHSISDIP